MRSLGVIFARGSSKRLPRKNLKSLLGVPLVAWSLRAALASRIDRVIISTEDDEIAKVAKAYGGEAPFRRPAELTADYADSQAILGHALDWAVRNEGFAYDVVVLIQPTTPFVRPEDFDACLKVLEETDAACCFTAREVFEPPHWMFVRAEDGVVRPLISGTIHGEREQSQLLPDYYFPTGAAWAIRASAFREQNGVYCEPLRIVLMDDERSIDIDDTYDWVVAEALVRHYGFKPIEIP